MTPELNHPVMRPKIRWGEGGERMQKKVQRQDRGLCDFFLKLFVSIINFHKTSWLFDIETSYSTLNASFL